MSLTTKVTSDAPLPQQPDQRMAAVPAGPRIGKYVRGHCAQTEGVIEFAIGQQSGSGGDPGAMELQLHAPVEIEPERAIDQFTRWVSKMASCDPD